jgi:hypothetical protein
VKWHELLPGACEAKLTLPMALADKFRFQPGSEYADQFDVFIDHAAVSIPSPA